jgi:CheY-like chemotaxis protein
MNLEHPSNEGRLRHTRSCVFRRTVFQRAILADARPERRYEIQRHPVPDSETRPRILAVDDEENIRRLYVRLLETLGYQAETAADADHALQIMQVSPPSVVICDIWMPGHDGAWLIDRINELYPTIPIVIATALSELDGRLILRPNVAGYIVKPFSINAFKRGLTKAFDLAGRLTASKTGEPLAGPRSLDDPERE